MTNSQNFKICTLCGDQTGLGNFLPLKHVQRGRERERNRHWEAQSFLFPGRFGWPGFLHGSRPRLSLVVNSGCDLPSADNSQPPSQPTAPDSGKRAKARSHGSPESPLWSYWRGSFHLNVRGWQVLSSPLLTQSAHPGRLAPPLAAHSKSQSGDEV